MTVSASVREKVPAKGLLSLKALPRDERPRERLIRLGPDQLSDQELLAILLGTGIQGQSVIELASRLMHHCETEAQDKGLLYLLQLRGTELQRVIPGVGVAKLSVILAALELGRRASQPKLLTVDLSNPRAVYEYLRAKSFWTDQEEFLVIHLNAKNRVLGVESVSKGTLTGTLVHPREIFKSAVRRSAHAIILAHNHPSGDPTPSREDHEVTRRLIAAGKLIGIEVLDHLVIGAERYTSFREHRLVEWP